MKRRLLTRATGYAGRAVRDAVRYSRDTSFGTFARQAPDGLQSLMTALPQAALLPHKEALLSLARLTMEHRFDLLGSGWVELTPRAETVNFSNRRRSASLRGMMDAAYQPIDWQCDFKSGFRWSERTWHRHIRFGDLAGVDVKVPWELARMQHLPRLALAYGLSPDAGYPREFCNQVLDFAASNPPRFGVNWICAMDVAIRAANWLVAFDLFRAYGAQFQPQFQEAFARLILEHGRYVRTHLERRGKTRNNHYLAGISGLIFIAAFLPRTRETEAWLRFATGELIREVRHQFHADGSNFEGSTSYHRLSGEMVYFATALLLGLPDPPAFPAWYNERLAKIAEFTDALRSPDGTVPQIGDNDSGRFFHLTPMYQKLSVREARAKYIHLRRYEAQPDNASYWDLDDCDHSHLLDAAAGLFCSEAPHTLEGAAIRSMSHNRVLTVKERLHSGLCAPGEDDALAVHGDPRDICTLDVGRSPVKYQAFPDFGVYVYSNEQFFLSIRCGGARGGHAHDDHLSIELHHRGEILFRDPGTYVYTPHPTLRRCYRSLAAHAVPYPVEQVSGAPIFKAAELGRSQCRYAGPDQFIGLGEYGEKRRAYRCVEIRNGRLEITDYLNTPALPESSETIPYSSGYGKLTSEWIRGGRPRVEQAATCVC